MIPTAKGSNTIKKVLDHKLPVTLVIVTLVIASMTFIGGSTYPIAFSALWVAYVIALAFGIALIRKDVKHD